MILAKRLKNLPVGRKVAAALLVMMIAVLVVANVTFISAAYWISQESVAPQALADPGPAVRQPGAQPRGAGLAGGGRGAAAPADGYAPLRLAAVYDSQGQRLAELHNGDRLQVPARFEELQTWRLREFRTNLLVELPRPEGAPGHLLLVASSELPGAFYRGTLTASLAILTFSILLCWWWRGRSRDSSPCRSANWKNSRAR